MPTTSKFARKLLNGAYGAWFLVVFSCVSLTTLTIVAVLPGQARRRSMARLGARLLFLLTGSMPAVSGMTLLPEGPSVVVANHASYLDGVLLTAVLPPRFQFVIKREMTEIPIAHFFLRRIGAHFVDRFDPRKGASDARRILQTASDGGSLAFFPEGTFRREPGLRRFQNGAFSIAARNKLPVVPIAISGTRSMLPAHVWLPRPARLAVIVSTPIPAAVAADPLAARDRSRLQILEALEEPDLQAAAAGN